MDNRLQLRVPYEWIDAAACLGLSEPVCPPGYFSCFLEKRSKWSGQRQHQPCLALPWAWAWGLVMQWELPELDFFALPATSKKNCRTHEVRHATKTGELQLAGVELTAAALAGWLSGCLAVAIM